MRVCAAAETKVHDPIEIPELGDVLEAEVAQMLPEFLANGDGEEDDPEFD